ncbi:hypothetical protein KVH30_02105 [Streptomyces olivaceus]|uniref:hypothetical protein n=1 Tax=Streptomyces olivaceus TaxID=47716 RepID=UPI001CCB3F5B|nr:hypothetical protein [Streptomyces olivaceus]MBZ6290365.1 hypothetical protein [Streptomyces olivaceus]MBZ6324317.1 hypothetical protein [Streptomyces olivaceus]
MKSSGTTALAPASLSTHRLLHAPLPELLAEHGVEVVELEADPGFTGGSFVRGDGSVLFVRPAGRPVVEWEITARALLGRVLRVPLPPVPAPFEVTEV